MTDPAEPRRHASEHPDEAEHSNADGALSKDQAELMDEVTDGPRSPALDFRVVNDEKDGIYEAIAGDTKIAGLPYNVVGTDRVVLLATSVFPEFRKQGVATELIRRVLDDVRAQEKTVTVMCPIVHGFIERNPEYGDLIDREHPGAAAGHRA